MRDLWLLNWAFFCSASRSILLYNRGAACLLLSCDAFMLARESKGKFAQWFYAFGHSFNGKRSVSADLPSISSKV
ncbi:hypothetical protein HPTD01_2978 [Halomonas sp. TD01]|nr:hypothetical protein HPTD01_2978 [Halomonas sp. TD01]